MRLEKKVLFWLAAMAILLGAVAVLRDVLLPFVAGASIAYFLNPLADRLERIGFGRTAAASLIVAVGGLLVVLSLVFLAPLAAGQLRQLALSLPGDLERLRAGIETWAEQQFGHRFPEIRAGLERAWAEIAQGSAGMLGQVARTIVSQGLALYSLVSILLVTPIVVFYLLRDWHTMLGRIDGWLPREHAPTIRGLALGVDGAVSAFVRGQGTICLILGILYAAALSAIGLRYGLLIGLVTGLLAFVPFVGWAMGLVTALIVAVTQAWPELGLAAMVLGVFAAGMVLDSAVLSPGIVGSRIGLHPVWLIFALLVFSALFGFLGVLVAVPVAAALGVLVRFARDRYLESSIYLGAAATATGEPGVMPLVRRD